MSNEENVIEYTIKYWDEYYDFPNKDALLDFLEEEYNEDPYNIEMLDSISDREGTYYAFGCDSKDIVKVD